ncbi:MAG: DNA mismatch repair protein MutS [Opitutae bacterium]|jgi:dsDNA-specific endonuclease/ATPase MutS2|nr:DNA mismatch repair protein MutS [Opitutae bacterium]|tara:strand:+ start:176 stop:469 length:294 start_codon:yes stop_codon:yes gene_type:complete
MKNNGEMDAVEIPIDGTLDLHGFRPADIGDLVEAYLHECRSREILRGRIIHGKGIGTLRETVHATLRKLSFVKGFRLGDESSGSWGATLFELQPQDK